MVVTHTVCSECGERPNTKTPYCPSCGEESPWEEVPTYEFDEDDLPIAFSFSVSEDNWELWDAFCHQYFGGAGLVGSDIEGLPDEFPRLKCCFVDIWFVVTEEYEVEGPFLEQPST